MESTSKFLLQSSDQSDTLQLLKRPVVFTWPPPSVTQWGNTRAAHKAPMASNSSKPAKPHIIVELFIFVFYAGSEIKRNLCNKLTTLWHESNFHFIGRLGGESTTIFPRNGLVVRSFGVLFLNKQSSCRYFETPLRLSYGVTAMLYSPSIQHHVVGDVIAGVK